MLGGCNKPVRLIIKLTSCCQAVYLVSPVSGKYNCWSTERNKYVNNHAVNDKELCYYLKGTGLEFGASTFDLAEGQNPCDMPLCGELD